MRTRTYVLRSISDSTMTRLYTDRVYSIGDIVRYKHPTKASQDFFDVVEVIEGYDPNYSYEKMRGLSM